MTMNYETQLAAIEQELARQDAELAIAREQLAALGDCELRIGDDVFSEIDQAYAVKSPSCGSTNLQLLRV